MTTTDKNGVVRWLGVSVDAWANLIERVGWSTIMLMFVGWMIWKYVPPVVDAHVKLLDRTGDTLESMDETLKQSNAILLEVSDVERETSAFMKHVDETHEKQNGKLDVIIDQTKK